ncbi:Mercuric reductase [Ignavibacterium album JCM 16511]|uniref:Mercuric reductase n=1 Tax=Ignavibacterium album (strain DSM 19864 / JCM 16511 / NBRC 101810 / Mat9-16) TaxID=945713 RepID=I0AKZ9_IGNAJ|nr:mercury(II) reductase [Ignavibacterium album]AFH49656.1 Mercuric reductase [Ignavibacterium album JCM 16511]
MTIQTLKLEISGMTCDHCAKTIEKKVSAVDGVVSKSVSYPEKKGEFQFDSKKTSAKEIIDAINSTGHYKVVGEIKKENEESTQFDLIIIGGGSAAFSAAIKASELQKKVLMINDGLPIGGTCVNVGCVPSKTLIRTAEQFHFANHPNFSGIKPGNNEIDFKEVIRQKTELVEALKEHKYIDVLKDDDNVTIIKAYARLLDKNTVEADDKKYSAENILIATGSTTFVPDLPGLKETGYLTNETLYELEELPEHLIIIGGRYIALENAQMFARLGSKVTILQRSNRILPDEMPDVTETLKEYLEEEGIEILTGTKINSVNRKNSKVIINASVKDEEKIIEGTHIFIATGRKGNTKEFGLKELGIEIHKNSFIKTNEYLQTSIPNIYAAGDVTGEYLVIYSAAYEGSLAVQNMFGENQTKKDYSVFPYVIFTDPQVAGVGMDENQAYENKIEYEASTIQLKDVPRSLAARNTKGFIKLIRDKQTDKLIGARILASEGSELLMEISLAIKYGITVKELKQMFHPYLTLSEGIKLAAISFEKDVNKLSCCAV